MIEENHYANRLDLGIALQKSFTFYEKRLFFIQLL